MFIATALGVDRGGGQRQPLYRVDDEVDQIILGHPIAQVWGQQEGAVAVDGFEALRHVALINPPGPEIVQFTLIFPPKKSERLLAGC